MRRGFGSILELERRRGLSPPLDREKRLGLDYRLELERKRWPGPSWIGRELRDWPSFEAGEGSESASFQSWKGNFGFVPPGDGEKVCAWPLLEWEGRQVFAYLVPRKNLGLVHSLEREIRHGLRPVLEREGWRGLVSFLERQKRRATGPLLDLESRFGIAPPTGAREESLVWPPSRRKGKRRLDPSWSWRRGEGLPPFLKQTWTRGLVLLLER